MQPELLLGGFRSEEIHPFGGLDYNLSTKSKRCPRATTPPQCESSVVGKAWMERPY